MINYNLEEIGYKLMNIRKKFGFTQSNVAEMSGISDRTYADIERGTVNMRVETLLHICDALRITPNDILMTDEPQNSLSEKEFYEKIASLAPNERNALLKIIDIFINSTISN